MEKFCCLSILVAICSVDVADFYGSYQALMPNGGNVPNPCSGGIWKGVGHNSANGGGSLNKFGSDFDNAGRTWTKAFCNQDSDGDGKSNGQELGDPDCVWQKGATPARTSDLTNPAICDPTGSEICKSSSNSCADATNNEGESKEGGSEEDGGSEADDSEETGGGGGGSEEAGGESMETGGGAGGGGENPPNEYYYYYYYPIYGHGSKERGRRRHRRRRRRRQRNSNQQSGTGEAFGKANGLQANFYKAAVLTVLFIAELL